MPFEVETAAHGVKLILLGRLGIRQAAGLWDALKPALTAGTNIQLQADELEDMDTSIVQILCRLNARASQLQIGPTSDGFLLSLQRRGLEKLLLHPSGSNQSEAKLPLPKAAEAEKIGLNRRPQHG